MLFNGLQTLDEFHWSSQCPREVKKPKSPQASRHFDACMFLCDKGAIIHFNLPIGNTNQG